ncbi:MAG: histidinol dehydrogenase [Oscillospiraceae bacterium]|nr:histidinol dehydrogenase [Oscillospiraceae bacterium]
MIRILRYGKDTNEDIFTRFTPQYGVEDVVAEILDTVRREGDRALFAYNEKFDGAVTEELRVSEAEIAEAMELTEPGLLEVIRQAAANIRKFHEKQVRSGFIINDVSGVLMGQKVTPIEKVGLYVPGGTAPYPSTVLMDAIPAKIAGCSELVMVTPPGRDGRVNPAILAAAYIAGVDKIFKVGGAQAVAALAFGTESIPRVEKIVGPGNAYVAEAKKQVYGFVAIDGFAGPSEVLMVADGRTDPRYAAADMLAQAEHDKMSTAVLLTDSEALASSVAQELEKQLAVLPRREIAAASLEKNGKIIITDSIAQAVEIANELAPEHLELCLDNPFDYLDMVKNAGSVFLGRYAPEPLGDYFGGTNHTLPTGGTAKFASPLSVDDFVKKYQYTYYTRDAFSRVAEDIARFARQEELEGHARSCLVRFEGEEQ